MNDGSVIIDVEFNTDKARKQYQNFGNEAAQQLDKRLESPKPSTHFLNNLLSLPKASLSILAVGTAVAGFQLNQQLICKLWMRNSHKYSAIWKRMLKVALIQSLKKQIFCLIV